MPLCLQLQPPGLHAAEKPGSACAETDAEAVRSRDQTDSAEAKDAIRHFLNQVHSHQNDVRSAQLMSLIRAFTISVQHAPWPFHDQLHHVKIPGCYKAAVRAKHQDNMQPTSTEAYQH